MRFALLLSRWSALLVSFLVCSSAIRINVLGILSAMPIQRTILLVLALLGDCFAPPVLTALVLSFVVA